MDTIPKLMVLKSFLKTGITNALDRSQNHKIAKEKEVMRMEVTQDDILGPDSNDEESEDFFDF